MQTRDGPIAYVPGLAEHLGEQKSVIFLEIVVNQLDESTCSHWNSSICLNLAVPQALLGTAAVLTGSIPGVRGYKDSLPCFIEKRKS